MQQDEKLTIKQDLLLNRDSHPGYSLRKGVLLYKGHLVIPKTSPNKQKFLLEFHASLSGGHSRFFKTYKCIAAILYWEGMKGNIGDFVAACSTCQQNKCEALSSGSFSTLTNSKSGMR